MVSNSPVWVEVDVKGDATGEQYYGRFCVKPFLTHAEKADAQRLADRYTNNMEESPIKNFMRLLAYLKLHIQDVEAPWWVENGLTLMDESPVYELAKKLDEIRQPKGAKDESSNS